MNTFGPILVCMVLIFNLYAVMYFYVFPYTDLLEWDADIVNQTSLTIHYIFFSLYLVLFLMTIWSFVVASCTDPGYVPRNIKNYDKAKLPQRELLLWNYIEYLGIDPNDDQDMQSLGHAHYLHNIPQSTNGSESALGTVSNK